MIFSRKLFFLLTLAVAGLVVEPASAETVYSFSTQLQSAERYDGQIFDLNADVPVATKTHIIPGVRQLERSYDGGTSISETTLVMGLTQKFSKGYYLNGETTYTPDALIAPQWAVGFQPHYAFGVNDVGLSFGYSKYSNLRAGSLGASYYRDLTRLFSFSMAAIFARTEHWLTAGQSHLIYRPTEKSEVRFVFAGGETLESAGVEARFTSETLECLFKVAQRLRIGGGFTHYNSTLRSEDSILLKLEAR